MAVWNRGPWGGGGASRGTNVSSSANRPTIRQVEGSAPEKISRMRFTAPKVHAQLYGGGPRADVARRQFRAYVNAAKDYIAPRTGTQRAAYSGRLQSAEDAWGGLTPFQSAVNELGPNLQQYLVAQPPRDEPRELREFRLGREQRALDMLGEIAGRDLGLDQEPLRQRRINTLRTYLQNPINYDI